MCMWDGIEKKAEDLYFKILTVFISVLIVIGDLFIIINILSSLVLLQWRPITFVIRNKHG